MENPLRDRPAPRGLTLIEDGLLGRRGATARAFASRAAWVRGGGLGLDCARFSRLRFPTARARWRLTLDAAGVIRQEHHPLPPDIDTVARGAVRFAVGL